jgi:hypothetical protein
MSARVQTLAVRAGIDRDEAFGAVTPPIVLSSNFSFAGFNEKRCYDYTRSGNPTRDLFAGAIAELEGGAGAVATASGMAAVALVLNALLSPGDRIVVPHDGYGGSWRLFDALARKGHFILDIVDLTDARALAAALFAAGLPCGDDANMGKLMASDASWHAAEACLQSHGGFGFAREYDVERKWRETRLFQIAPISTNMVLAYISEHILGMPRSY